MDENPNVLIVDDVPENLLSLEAVLGTLPANLIRARSGEEALRCVLRHDFAAILLDVNMPDMDGYETAERIRQRGQSANTPIIFVTASGPADVTATRGYRLGAVDFLFKPLAAEVLRAKVGALVELYRAARTAQRRAEELAGVNRQLQDEVAARQAAERELREAHDELERRVQKRTVELTERTAELESANSELCGRNGELAEFAFVTSHDLQEPLRRLVSFSSLLSRDAGESLPEEARKDLGFITEAARRMQVLVRDLLALSRTGHSDIRREHVSLLDCAEHALEVLADRVQEISADVSHEELPEVMGDATILTQLYQNLIGNALKFHARDRHPEICLTAKRDDCRWVLGVRDNGIGLDPKYAEQIFAPFKRLHASHEYEGTGIGLAICRKVVERHGGKIWVESEPGHGAHFKFTLLSD